MKIIAVDNYARETVANRLVSSNLDQKTGEIMLASLLKSVRVGDPTYYRMVDDDYRLSKGMEDLV